MGIAALSGYCIDRFDIFRAEIVEDFADQANGFVFAQTRFHGPIEFVVGGVDHHRRSVEQRYFILRLDDARFRHQGLAVNNLDALFLQRKQYWQFDDVDPDRLFVQAAFFEFDANFLRHIFSAAHFRRHRSTQHRNSRVGATVEPWAVELMMLGGRAEIPKNWLVILWQQR